MRETAALAAQHPQHASAICTFVLARGKNHGGGPATTEPQIDQRTPEQIGPYRVLELIGQGGMGSVYLAEQKKPIRRRVALKVIKLGMDTRAMLARFEAERAALSRMDHPHIARFFDAGSTERGQPFFVMEHVPGIPLTRYADEHRLSVEDRLRLFQQVCAGAQHAHTKGVIHRDLTPNNVLVGIVDGRPLAKIIDFGLAKAIDGGLTEKTVFTHRGMALGTPEYMSPEQAGRDGLDIDTRTDVYTLGVLLYELLTGTTPFQDKGLRAAGLEGMCKLIREGDVARPSSKLAGAADSIAVARVRRTHKRALLRRLRGDLDWIVLKCLEKDRTRRYETPTALSEDVERHLHDEPVLARAPTLGYRLRKIGAHYRGPLIAAGLVVVALSGGLVGTIHFALQARAKATEAQINEGRAREQKQQIEAQTQIFRAEVMHRDMLAEQETLYPAQDKLPELSDWERRANSLLDQRKFLEEALLRIRTRGLPHEGERIPTGAESAEAVKWRARLATLRSVQAARESGRALPMVDLPAEAASANAFDLNHEAWARVAPKPVEREVYGEEGLGLAYALASVARVEKGDSSWAEHAAFDTLAWALFAVGRDDDALLASERAVVAAPEQEKATYRGFKTDLARAIANAAETLHQTVLEVARLEAATADGSGFASEDRFLQDTLSGLLQDLAALEAKALPSVQRRIAWAKAAPGLSIGQYRDRWNDARAAIAAANGTTASDAYGVGRIVLEPQLGLVPIGMNPKTKLWEFYDLASAANPHFVPGHQADGRIDVTADTGIVFVLLPGGKFWMGAQSQDRQGPNFDPSARSEEGPPGQVTLAPFFLARHEITQAQWRRLTDGLEPSHFRAGSVAANGVTVTWSNPVEQVDWSTADKWLGRHSLALPSEAQWEYGVRGGTSSASYVAGAVSDHARPAVDNIHWPVGGLAMNPFGLHDVYGNVGEWTRDGDRLRGHTPREGDGLCRDPLGSNLRALRGFFFTPAKQNGNRVAQSRSAARWFVPPHLRNASIGVRPARAMRP